MLFPSVSIIIPVFNVAPYIYKCLESIVKQSYQGKIECLIVDDCGEDNSIVLAKDFISNYNGDIQFRIINREKNGGLSAARNSGIRQATGEYLYFLDSDDSISTDCINLLVETLLKYPEAQCVFAGAKASKGYEWMSYCSKDLPDYSNNPKWIQTVLACRYILNMTAWNRLIRRSFILNNNLFFDEGWTHEDELWTVDISLCLTSIAICKNDTYNYNVRDTGIVAGEKTEKMFENRMKVWNHMLDKLPHNVNDALIGCLFMMQNHKELILDAHKKLHNEYLGKISKKSNSLAVCILRVYLLLPEIIKKNDFIFRFATYFVNPYRIFKTINPIV